jgi:hypothetical protein
MHSQACFPAQLRRISSELVQQFRIILGADKVTTHSETLKAHNTDWTGQLHGRSQLLLEPRNTRDVSNILKHCNEHRCVPNFVGRVRVSDMHSLYAPATKHRLAQVQAAEGISRMHAEYRWYPKGATQGLQAVPFQQVAKSS